MTSHWLEQALVADRDVAPALESDDRAYVCIVGGGYTGLWTAINLKKNEPSLDVVVVEKEVCGSGGSGANAGYALGLWVQFPALQRMCGTDEALRLCRASTAAIAEMQTFCEQRKIDIEIQRKGAIWGATCDAQAGHWDEIMDLLDRLQERPFIRLSQDQIAERTGTRAHVAGALDPNAALIQPAFFVRGLRRVALQCGVRLFEHSPMTRLDRARPRRVLTARGTVTADRVVLAMYAWSLGIPELGPPSP